MTGRLFALDSRSIRIAVSVGAVLSAPGALAQEAGGEIHDRDLDMIVISSQSVNGPQDSPSQGSLVSTQPVSVITGEFIRDNDSPAANYTDIIKFTPSVWTVDPNGPGLMENLNISIRGFQDGFFNVTFDGIPWGDSNDFTHHSTSYFMAQNIGSVVVDRGPGNAATLGDATFGGTVAVMSDDPSRDMRLTATLSDGSFSTRLAGARFDSGTLENWGGVRAFLDVESLASDGYLSNSRLNRTNAFFKAVQPIGDSTTITLASNLNKLQQNPPIGETYPQIQAFGVNYAYNADPTSQSYFGYNLDRISTDYEYIGVSSQFLGFRLNNNLYTYAYYHDGFNGEDVNGQLPNGTYPSGEITNGTLYGPNDVPGQRLTNNYRSVGDIFRLEHDLGPGTAQIGVWYDHQTNYRALLEIDFSDNMAYNPLGLGPATLGVTVPDALDSADRLMHDQLFTDQEYVQYVLHALDALDVTGGVKLVRFERLLDAPVNQGTMLPLVYDKSWSRSLPSIDAHYKISDNWSAYAQWAQGFLAPNLNVLYTTNPAESNLRPQSTTNYQIGTTYTDQRMSFSADAYYINFNNEIASETIDEIKIFFNQGGTRYRGFETEGSFVLGAGFTVYANGSVNAAHATSDQTWIADTPIRTAALGLSYGQGRLQGSLMERYIGMRYGNPENQNPLGGYGTIDGAINYVFLRSVGVLDNAKLGIQLQNLLDRTSIYFLNGTTAGGQPLYFTIPGRSVEVTLTASIH
jgi:iron complex outermembrane receptor protein